MTIDERLEVLAVRHEALSHTVELIAAMQLKTEERLTQLARAQAVTDRRLSRAIKLSAEETLRERERRRESIAQLDSKLDQLAAAQLVTEQLLQRFLARGGNGHS
jgi:hypothetical protein